MVKGFLGSLRGEIGREGGEQGEMAFCLVLRDVVKLDN